MRGRVEGGLGRAGEREGGRESGRERERAREAVRGRGEGGLGRAGEREGGRESGRERERAREAIRGRGEGGMGGREREGVGGREREKGRESGRERERAREAVRGRGEGGRGRAGEREREGEREGEWERERERAREGGRESEGGCERERRGRAREGGIGREREGEREREGGREREMRGRVWEGGRERERVRERAREAGRGRGEGVQHTREEGSVAVKVVAHLFNNRVIITTYPNLSPDCQIYPKLLKPADLPQPFKKVVRSNPATQLASTSNPRRTLTGTEATWPPRQKRKEIKSRSVFSLSSRWSLSLSFSLVLHLPSPRSVFFTPSLSFPTEASPSQTPSRPSPSLFWLALEPAQRTPSRPSPSSSAGSPPSSSFSSPSTAALSATAVSPSQPLLLSPPSPLPLSQILKQRKGQSRRSNFSFSPPSFSFWASSSLSIPRELASPGPSSSVSTAHTCT